MTPARQLSDRLASLYRNERQAMADFLIALSDFDQRKAWRELGFPSLWAYLTRELKLSSTAAFQRKTAAELIRVHPAVGDALRSGGLCLSTVSELARVLTPENAAEVLPRFLGLSLREAAGVSASLRPKEVIPSRDVVRLIPSSTAGAPLPAASASPTPLPAPEVPAADLALPPLPAPEVRPSTRPPPQPARVLTTNFLDADRARISVTVPRRVLHKLEAARDALAHVLPGGNLADVIEYALDLVLAESKKKRGLVEKPRKPSNTSRIGSRHVPAEVARAVWKRAVGRCECLLPDGSRCDATRALELDHIEPWALGGKATVENIRVACRECNQLAARRAFGDQLVDRYVRRKTARQRRPTGNAAQAPPFDFAVAPPAASGTPTRCEAEARGAP